ncbi:hypothetical protein CRI93_14750 [Longimonas halophila]|uniref:Nucleotidyl transferase AbiEii/AbiGii toxin family protein n=1 Tax=Longimonas halophila TaxID=1469170 RepID=A0A2H3NWZ5_9BACT|nr:nucleotidyl transferase AbiEii/AbiGii toxin family protein [Longimonas halophila]PEN04695.1 hypothetical protein CRI93_14750 [Longimonas halophila]
MPHLPDDDAIYAVLHALSLDRTLHEQFVLKGGNALRLAYKSPRSSVDVDFSSTEAFPDQPDATTQALLKDVEARLNRVLEEVAPIYDFASLVIQSTDVHPGNHDPRAFPALEIKVGYSELDDRDPPFSDVVKLEITLNEVVCADEYVSVDSGRAGNVDLHVSGLDDIIAEKLRSLLQQVTRNRNRPGDVYDIWFFTTRVGAALSADNIATYLQKKSHDRLGVDQVTHDMFTDPEVRKRASVGYDDIASRLPDGETLPPFEDAFDQVIQFVEALDLP